MSHRCCCCLKASHKSAATILVRMQEHLLRRRPSPSSFFHFSLFILFVPPTDGQCRPSVFHFLKYFTSPTGGRVPSPAGSFLLSCIHSPEQLLAMINDPDPKENIPPRFEREKIPVDGAHLRQDDKRRTIQADEEQEQHMMRRQMGNDWPRSRPSAQPLYGSRRRCCRLRRRAWNQQDRARVHKGRRRRRRRRRPAGCKSLRLKAQSIRGGGGAALFS